MAIKNAVKSAVKSYTAKSTSGSKSSTSKNTYTAPKTSYGSSTSKNTSAAAKTTTSKTTTNNNAAAQKAAQQKANADALAKQQAAQKAAEAKKQAEIAAQKKAAEQAAAKKAAQQKANADALAKQQAAQKAAEAKRQAEIAAQQAAAQKAKEEADKRAAAQAIQQRQRATEAKNNTDYFNALSAAQHGYATSGLSGQSAAFLNPAFPFSWWGWLFGDGDSPTGGGADSGTLNAVGSHISLPPVLGATIGNALTNLANRIPFDVAAAAENAGGGSASAYNTAAGGSSYRGGSSSGGYGGYGSGGGSGSSGDELTDEEKEAAKNQNALAKMNIQDLQNQLNHQLDIYNQADAQNKRLANAERTQASRKAESDRFDAQRNLQAASLSLMGDMGQAMNGSSTGNLMRMLESRNDLEDSAQLSQLLSNWEQTNNQYNDTVNQNRIARMEAMANAEKAINDATRNWMAALNNIDPSLFPKEGVVNGDKSLAASTAWKRKNEGAAVTSGFLAPFVRGDNRGKGGTPQGEANPAQSMNVGYTRNRQLGGDYFSRLINQFNRR